MISGPAHPAVMISVRRSGGARNFRRFSTGFLSAPDPSVGRRQNRVGSRAIAPRSTLHTYRSVPVLFLPALIQQAVHGTADFARSLPRRVQILISLLRSWGTGLPT